MSFQAIKGKLPIVGLCKQKSVKQCTPEVCTIPPLISVLDLVQLFIFLLTQNPLGTSLSFFISLMHTLLDKVKFV